VAAIPAAFALLLTMRAASGQGRAGAGPAPEPSPLIFPQQAMPLAFNHARHLKLAIGCDTCHDRALTSTSAADNLIPVEASCRACHEIDRTKPFKTIEGSPPARCDACHPGWSGAPAEPPRVVVPRPNIKFNHQLHAVRGIGCETCHTNVARAAMATRADLPTMSLCLGCHTGGAGTWVPPRKPAPPAAAAPPPAAAAEPELPLEPGAEDEPEIVTPVAGPPAGAAPPAPAPAAATAPAPAAAKRPTGRCGACHITLPDGRLKVNLAGGGPLATATAGKLVPSGVLRGFDAHTPAFRTDHRIAGRDESYCLSCHRRSECLDCHAGTVRPMDIHPSDYVSLHGIDARRNVPDCSACHRGQTFCVGCHQRTGVAADPEGGLPGHQPSNPFGTGTQVKRFHPPGWARDASGDLIGTPGPNSHSFQAKRNIRSCASCHREESCLECHSTDTSRSANVNPHGIGFADSARCHALSSRNRRACLKCHALGTPELDCR